MSDEMERAREWCKKRNPGSEPLAYIVELLARGRKA
jgi:hypothetical protein